jgi:hypothetical protein
MPPINEAPRALDFIVSEANGWRSREKVTMRTPLVPATGIVYMPGTLLYPEGAMTGPPAVLTGNYLAVTAATEIDFANAILMYATDTRPGLVEVATIMRDAEVNEAYLLYTFALTGGADFSAAQILLANAALLNNRILVRHAVLAESIIAPPPGP